MNTIKQFGNQLRSMFMMLLIGGAAVAVPITVSAQTNPAPAHAAHKGQGWLKQLNLTDAQKQQIKAIRKADAPNMKAERNAVKTDPKNTQQRKDARAKLQADRESKMQQIRNVLTPDQQVKFDKMIADRKANMASRQAQRKAARQAAQPATTK